MSQRIFVTFVAAVFSENSGLQGSRGNKTRLCKKRLVESYSIWAWLTKCLCCTTCISKRHFPAISSHRGPRQNTQPSSTDILVFNKVVPIFVGPDIRKPMAREISQNSHISYNFLVAIIIRILGKFMATHKKWWFSTLSTYLLYYLQRVIHWTMWMSAYIYNTP